MKSGVIVLVGGWMTLMGAGPDVHRATAPAALAAGGSDGPMLAAVEQGAGVQGQPGQNATAAAVPAAPAGLQPNANYSYDPSGRVIRSSLMASRRRTPWAIWTCRRCSASG